MLPKIFTNIISVCICSGKSKSKLSVAAKQQRHQVRSSSRVHFVGLTPSEPSSPGDNRPSNNTLTNVGLPAPASTDNGQVDNLRRYQGYCQSEVTAASDSLRPVQVISPAGGLPGLAAGSAVRRTLYSPRYTSDGRLKHCLATTTNDILSTHNADH